MTDRYAACFAACRQARRIALMPYLTGGFPDLDTCLELILAVQEAGADALELGIPFSDPLADGPTIQATSQKALERGVAPRDVLALVERARARGLTIPVTLMTYLNPVLRLGAERFCAAARAAGVDGLIVPDLPVEAADELLPALQANGLAPVFLAAPTSDEERLERIAKASRGFLYYVSLRGVTGARAELDPRLAERLRIVRGHGTLPICVGFGISRPEHVRALHGLADGAIVGSALLDRIAAASARPDAVRAAREFLADLVPATRA